MARKRIPGQILEARGSFKHNPQRRRTGEPVVDTPLGIAPESFTAPEREAWQEIVTRAPTGALTSADGPAVVIAAKLYSEFLRDSGAMNAARIGRLQSLLGAFGMTPSDRAGLSIPQPKAENPFAMLDRIARP